MLTHLDDLALFWRVVARLPREVGRLEFLLVDKGGRWVSQWRRVVNVVYQHADRLENVDTMVPIDLISEVVDNGVATDDRHLILNSNLQEVEKTRQLLAKRLVDRHAAQDTVKGLFMVA